MSRYTTAYSEFVGRCDEVLILVKRARELERSRSAFSHGPEIDALCRGAIVLLSSHVEAYVKELGECALDAIFRRKVCRSKLSPRLFFYASKGWVDRLKDTSEPERVSAEVFGFLSGDAHLWVKSGPLPSPIDSEEFARGFANPKFDKVRKFLGRFGYDGLRHHINLSLGRDAVLAISNLDQIVDTRNAIAHGEASATKTPGEVTTLVASARQLCRTVDDGFSAWCKGAMCTIR